jgi:hypothetical protein
MLQTAKGPHEPHSRGRHLPGIPHGNEIDSLNAQLIADPSDYFIRRSPCLVALRLSYGAAEPVLETRRAEARVIAG